MCGGLWVIPSRTVTGIEVVLLPHTVGSRTKDTVSNVLKKVVRIGKHIKNPLVLTLHAEASTYRNTAS